MADLAIEKGSDGISAFVYGTLMEPQVLFSVLYNNSNPDETLKKKHTFKPAILQGYCRHRVQHADYPGMIAQDGQCVRGIVISGLTRGNVQSLDWFEGSEYERRVVRPRLITPDAEESDHSGGAQRLGMADVTGSKGEGVEASTYIFIRSDRLETREWDFNEFRREKMSKWTRAGYVFEDCEVGDVAAVSDERSVNN